MQLSHVGLQFLKEREGLPGGKPALKAYKDSAGIWTIGYGTIRVDGKPVQEGMTCTVAQASLWLQADCASAQTAVNQLVKVPLSQGQFDALTSFVYNLGANAFAKSTLLRKLNGKDYAGAVSEFERWTNAGGKFVQGLLNRRRMEMELFRK